MRWEIENEIGSRGKGYEKRRGKDNVRVVEEEKKKMVLGGEEAELWP